LRSLPTESQGAVTGFHIIEHLPLETLFDLLAETRRVLRCGGLAIFETPNCKNLMVGACNFNVDPTHKNPIFPETAEFMLGAVGFEKTELKYSSPVETNGIPGAQDLSPLLRQLLYGPQDFAVIGRKPASR
jgi:O-antigen chain-terminating methyltransferase